MNLHARRPLLVTGFAALLASLAVSGLAQESQDFYTGYRVLSQTQLLTQGQSQPELRGERLAQSSVFTGHLGGGTEATSRSELGSLKASISSQALEGTRTHGLAEAMFGDLLTVSGARNTIVDIALTITLEEALEVQGDPQEWGIAAWLSVNGARLKERGRFLRPGGPVTEYGSSGTIVFQAPVNSTLFLEGGLLTDATLFGTARVSASGHARYFVEVLTPGASVSSASGATYTQAVPEPASLAVLGLGALAVLRRRKSAVKS